MLRRQAPLGAFFRVALDSCALRFRQSFTTWRPTAPKAFTPGEVNGWVGKALDIQVGPRGLAFTAETFFLSFSLPNFHFHAVTTYAIPRTRGVPIGKRDYEGWLRTGPGRGGGRFSPTTSAMPTKPGNGW